MKGRLYSFLAVVTIIFFAFLAGFALLHPALPPTHDGEYHVIRFYEFDKTLRGGDWYPRWAPDLNYGYGVPLFNYVYPMPNYVAFVLHLFGISFIDAFKLNMFFATIIGSAFFYLWAKQFWGKMGGVVSSVFYTFSPYHFVEIYIRGSIGEVWALAFFPAFLWSITRYIQNKLKIFFILSSLFLSLIIFSHNILALMFFPFALTYIGFLIYQSKYKKHLILNTLYIILLGLGLSSIFWLPAILESNLVKGLEIFDVARHFPDLYELLIPSWGSGFSGGDSQDHLSFQVGLANLLAFFLSFVALLFCFRKNKKFFAVIVFFQAWFVIIFLLMLKISYPIWKSVPLINYFQFPWRILSLEILIVSFLSGSMVFVMKNYFLNKIKAVVVISAACLISLSFMLGIGYARPAHYLYRDDNYYVTRSNFIDGTNSPGDVFNTIWFNQNLRKQNKKIIIDKGNLDSSVIKPTSHTYFVSNALTSKVTVNIAYFPNWTVFIDGKKITTRQDADGLISFFAPRGRHLIEVKFKDTTIRVLANFIFLASLFSIIFYSIKRYNFD